MSTESTVLALARYLTRNAGASDNREGIARWWLGSSVEEASLADALNWLTQQGVIQAKEALDGHLRYRLADGVDAVELERKVKAGLGNTSRGLH